MTTNVLMFILLLPIVFTFWAIMDLANRDLGSLKKKAVWAFIVVLVPYLGGPIYLIFGRKGAKKEAESIQPREGEGAAIGKVTNQKTGTQ
jgi:hypothetical protein